MRYIETKVQPVKETKTEKSEAPVKAGNKGYDYSNLASAKKIPTKGGWS